MASTLVYPFSSRSAIGGRQGKGIKWERARIGCPGRIEQLQLPVSTEGSGWGMAPTTGITGLCAASHGRPRPLGDAAAKPVQEGCERCGRLVAATGFAHTVFFTFGRIRPDDRSTRDRRT